jgi:hypothetical protein
MLKPGDVRPYILARKHPPYLRNKLRQLSCELGMLGCGTGEIGQPLTNDIVERRLELKTQFDRLGRLALLMPSTINN